MYNKKAVKKYALSEKGKAAHLRANRKYWQSEKGTVAHKRYHNTIKGHLQVVYSNICSHCNNSDNTQYKDYGGRGIKNKFKSLDDFRNYVINVLKIDPRGLQIDRINNDDNYEHGNIRFVIQAKNLQNKRKKYNKR